MAKEDISSKLMIFRSDRRKNRQNPTIGRKKSYLKGIRGYATMYKGGGSRHSFDRQWKKTMLLPIQYYSQMG